MRTVNLLNSQVEDDGFAIWLLKREDRHGLLELPFVQRYEAQSDNDRNLICQSSKYRI
jgi:hypothetical protein